MQLISLTVKNIRSYKEAKIEFPTGTVILSGDIGAGKSTVLLAIEFALFGLMRGELSGNALLRNGSNEGSTELMFKLNDIIYVIKRTLKRTKKSAEQDTGYLLINGVKKEATPTELKSHILDLLGYPPELLTKGKNLVYRYTVYTPQEDMKKILLEEKEQRVAILRKVFGIDKYEKITTNAGTYTKTLREKQRAFNAALSDYEEKKKQLEETKKEQQETKQKITELEPKLNTTRKTLQETKKQLETIEKQKQQAEILTRELHTAKSILLTKEQQHKQTTTELQTAIKQLQEAQKELPEKTETTKKEDYTQLLLEKEQHNKKAVMKITELTTLKKQSAETSNKISILAQCPTCLQQVTQDHKHKILNTEKLKIAEIEQELTKHNKTAQQTEQEIQQIKQEIEKQRQQEKEQAIAQMKILRAEELARRKGMLEQQNKTLTTEVKTITTKIQQLEQELKPHQEINSVYEQTRKQAEQLMSQERQLSIEHSALQQKEQNHTKTTELLEKEIERKQKIKQQLEKTQKLHQWLTDY
ncbi:SMC family ATPase, partial [Candidatus Woesearchaeota archaeon]|nr:SMC family ATPase [Candidatus Woesearchaeota archaeon]